MYPAASFNVAGVATLPRATHDGHVGVTADKADVSHVRTKLDLPDRAQTALQVRDASIRVERRVIDRVGHPRAPRPACCPQLRDARVEGMNEVAVTSSVTINRPRHEVAAFAADPDNVKQWYEKIESVEWETSPPVRPGSRIAFVARFLGRRLAYTYEIRELVPSHRLVMSTAHGPFPMETTYTWEDSPGGGTRMTLRNRGEPAGFSKLTAPLMARAVRRANSKDLATLKKLLESRI